MEEMQLLSIPIMSTYNIVGHDEGSIPAERMDMVHDECFGQG